MSISKKYEAKSLAGATARVRMLEKQRAKLDDDLGRSLSEIKALRAQRAALAKLAAKGPTFFNPLEVFAAEALRDQILKDLGMNPDGTFIPRPA